MSKNGISITLVPVDSLRPAPWNPPQRTASVNLRSLVQSMRENGFWASSPIRVARDMMIIDGHRRWMAAKMAGIENVPVFVDESADPKAAYLTINSTVRPPTSREWLHAYLGGAQVPPRLRRDIMRIADVCGEQMLWRIAQANLSPRSLMAVGRRALRYIGISPDDDEWLSRVIRWAVDGRRQWQVRTATFYGNHIPPEELRQAIVEDRDVDLSKME